MDIINFLQAPIFAFPSVRKGQEIRAYLRDKYRGYSNFLNSIKKPDTNVQKILRVKDRIAEESDYIIEAIDYYFLGKPRTAFDSLDKSIQAVRSYFTRLSGSSKPDKWINRQGLYRVRLGTHQNYSKRDLFHIPFENRSKVSTQRYSIPGLPCLYLGSSVYVCWEELGRPDPTSMQIARFELTSEKNLKFVTVGPTPIYIVEQLNSYDYKNQSDHALNQFMVNAAVTVGVCWPIIQACSTIVEEPGEPFVPEYVIPQLLLQWVSSKEFVDGIQYPSVHVRHDLVATKYALNYVFPVKSSHNYTEFCAKLEKLFLMTEPISWSLLRAHMNHSSLRSANRSSEEDFRLIRGLEMNYFHTEFGSSEIILKELPATRIFDSCISIDHST